MINIPIYRARKIDSDEWVEGYLNRNVFTADFSIVGDSNGYGFNNYIDQKTLAIHFPNMTDKNGKKVFASLGEDGVGGDIVKIPDDYDTYGMNAGEEYKTYVAYGSARLKPKYTETAKGFLIEESDELEVIGTYKG